MNGEIPAKEILPVNIKSQEDARRIAQGMVERDAQITALLKELRAKGILRLELEMLLKANASAARLLADLLAPPPERPQICLTLMKPDASSTIPTSIEVSGNQITPPMLEAAEDLFHTLITGERQLPKDLYEVVARAFNTTRLDAKRRILFACYGGKEAPPLSHGYERLICLGEGEKPPT